jgi:hypothetical protein
MHLSGMRLSRARISYGSASHDVPLMGVHQPTLHLLYSKLHGRVPHGAYLINLHLTGMYLMGVHLIYEPSLRAGHGW